MQYERQCPLRIPERHESPSACNANSRPDKPLTESESANGQILLRRESSYRTKSFWGLYVEKTTFVPRSIRWHTLGNL